jgi:hypothetical protein
VILLESASAVRIGIAVVLLLCSCSGLSDETQERHRVAAAIDAMRAVPADDYVERARLADELSAMEVQSAPAKKARDTCAKAYRSLAESMRLTNVASAGLDPKSSADPAIVVAAARDAVAEKKASDEAMVDCSDASAAIRTRP